MVTTLVLVTLSCLLVFIQMTRKTYPGFARWSGAFVALAVGYIGLSLRGVAPDWLSILLANVLILTGMLLTFDGIVIFCGRQWSLRLNGPLHVALAVCIALLAYFTYVEYNLNARITIINIFRTACYLACAVALLRYTSAEGRSARNLLSAICVASSLLGIVRAIFAVASPPMAQLYDDPVFRVFMFLDLGVVIGIAFCLLLMTQVRVEEELEHARLEAHRASLTDKLTGLRNRAHFEAEVDRRIQEADRFSDELSLLMIDIDRFKKINDGFGHHVGDRVLCQVAERISARLRASDLFCRWGGEEFVVLMRNSIADASVVAESLRKAIADRPLDIVGNVTISIGVSDRRGQEDSLAWMLRVDQALYRAKENGRNRVEADAVQSRVSAPVYLRWNPVFSVGDPILDEQHRELVEKAVLLFEKFVAKDTDAAVELFRQLVDDIDRHCLYEEHLLRARNYAELDEHIDCHHRLRERADLVLADFESGRATLESLVDYAVKDLVMVHIAEEDRRYFPLLATSA